MKNFIVKFNGKYLIETPDWNSGKRTVDPNYATVYTEADLEFFNKYYKDIQLIEANEYQIIYYKRRMQIKENIRLHKDDDVFLPLKDLSNA